jgi:hypothetical protein
MKALALLGCLLALPAPAAAAAWTLPRGTWQEIASAIYSNADHGFDNRGNSATPELFQRALLQTDTEYGLTGKLTLFARTETALAYVHDGGQPPVTAVDNAFEGGARWRLWQGLGIVSDDDVLSLEGSVRTAGAFNFAFSANARSGGRDGGFRLLYGSGFRLWQHDGFLDLEAGERWLSNPRPDQTPIDLTTGVWLNPDWMVMLQSFNLVSGPATPPYSYFRSHKVELSGVWRLSRRFSLQAGAFFSPAGQNALDERGLALALWANF